jgi:ABC-type nitrate/sulfonate/bicarbonate transport system substrate-binding protein
MAIGPIMPSNLRTAAIASRSFRRSAGSAPSVFSMPYVRPAYAKANSDTVRAFSRALLAAIADIRDTPGKDQLPLTYRSG